MMDELSPLEMKALKEALEGPEGWKAQLRLQVAGASAISRTDTVVGGYTRIRTADSCLAADIPEGGPGYPPGVDVTHPALSHGGAFLVWTEGGRISILEYFTYNDERWPEASEDNSNDFAFIRRPTHPN
jgi:hypothetical protein